MAALSLETGSTHHCAIFHGDDHGTNIKSFKNCELHPGHKEFMTVDEFEKMNLSEINLDVDDMPLVRNRIDRTVRVVGNYISDDRPDTYMNSEKLYPCIEKRGSYNSKRYGTGYLLELYHYDVKEPCPCPECKTLTSQIPNRKSYYFVIKTATHVIFDKHEAQNTVFEFFYESEDRDDVKNVYGVTVLGSDPLLLLETDRCFVMCVTHDGSLAEKLRSLLGKFELKIFSSSLATLVSHPHGVSKRISVGEYLPIKCVVILDETSIILQKGMEIRFPGCHHVARVVQDINRLLRDDKPVIGIGHDETFVLLCDLTIYRPEGIVVEADFDNLELYLNQKKKVWWSLSQGTQLITSGKQYPLQHNNDVVCTVMELFECFEYYIDNRDIDKVNVFYSSSYNMASCPGSSGAHVECFGLENLLSVIGSVHIGCCGAHNVSSAIPVSRIPKKDKLLKMRMVHFECQQNADIFVSTSGCGPGIYSNHRLWLDSETWSLNEYKGHIKVTTK